MGEGGVDVLPFLLQVSSSEATITCNTNILSLSDKESVIVLLSLSTLWGSRER